MPVSLPSKSIAKTLSAERPVDCIGVWALALGAAAASIAGLIYFCGGEPVAASFVLIAAAMIIATVLREAARISERG
jgi:hypothetical protein